MSTRTKRQFTKKQKKAYKKTAVTATKKGLHGEAQWKKEYIANLNATDKKTKPKKHKGSAKPETAKSESPANIVESLSAYLEKKVDSQKKKQTKIRSRQTEVSTKSSCRRPAAAHIEKPIAHPEIKAKEDSVTQALRAFKPASEFAINYFKDSKVVLIAQTVIDAGNVIVAATGFAESLSKFKNMLEVHPDGTILPTKKEFQALVDLIRSSKELFDSIIELAKVAAKLAAKSS